METRYLADVPLSPLMLGTVQFGLPYGIANTHGQPSYETARDILACAFDGGVRCLDTAPGYGESEAVLGRAMAELGIADRMTVVSKTPHLADGQSLADVERFLEDHLRESLQRLQLEQLPVLLVHREENAAYLPAVQRMKDKGLVGHIGVSTMTPAMTARLIADGEVEAIQIPTNMLDQRFRRMGLLGMARDKRIALFIRSIYLQGLIVMPEADILPELAEVIPVRRRLAALAEEAGMAISELAMRYVMALEGVTCTIVGVETLQQMQENIAIFARGPLDSALCAAIEAAVPDLPEHIIVPFHWSKRMPDARLATAGQASA